MSDFNLTNAPWIPASTLSGTQEDLGIIDLLSKAHELRGFGALAPTEYPAILRLLLAILHRVYDGPKTYAAWGQILSAGLFDAERIEAYLGTVQERFDLFHETHPFAQTPGLTEKFAGKETDIRFLRFASASWGSSSSLFYREDPPPMTPAEAARALLAYHAFTPGGLVRKPGEPGSATAGPNNSTAIVSLAGRNLFETLCANLLIYDGKTKPFPSADDKPAWEQEPPPRDLSVAKEPAYQPKGWLDMLTWVSRRIQLIRGDDGRVQSFIRAVGKGMTKDLPDPMVAYRDVKRGSKLEHLPVGVHKERLFWRDSAALFAPRDTKAATPPKAFHQLHEAPVGTLPKPIGVMSHGMASYQASIHTTREESMWVAPALFGNRECYVQVEAVLGHANFVAGGLRAGVRTFARHVLSRGDRDPDPKDVDQLATSFNAEPMLWSELHGLYQRFLKELGKAPESPSPQTRFLERALRFVETRYAATAASLGEESSKAEVRGEESMRAYLAPLRAKLRERHEDEQKEAGTTADTSAPSQGASQ